jgi:hypothetical protein
VAVGSLSRTTTRHENAVGGNDAIVCKAELIGIESYPPPSTRFPFGQVSSSVVCWLLNSDTVVNAVEATT